MASGCPAQRSIYDQRIDHLSLPARERITISDAVIFTGCVAISVQVR
jgi:hypothetical protein